ncbi:MAG: hypothetical protein FPO08_05795 [Geobacter sp.]|nr:MAG: hypothetical protein FPO08_05795 [Geobacter sp.]
MEPLDIKETLSYCDYWLSKSVWRLDEAIGILVRHHVFNRKWMESDDIDTVASNHHRYIYSLINNHLPGNMVATEIPDFDGVQTIYDKRTTITPYNFISWCYLMKLDLPRELLEYIGELKKVRLTWDFVTKMMCQAVAKTVWDMNPDKTIENMIEHSAIQKHAAGKVTPHSTLRKWLSEVDRRPSEVKPGPNKAKVEDF